MEVETEIQPISQAESQIQDTTTNTDDQQPTATSKEGPLNSRERRTQGVSSFAENLRASETESLPNRKGKTQVSSARTEESRAPKERLPTNPERSQNSSTRTEETQAPGTGLPTNRERSQNSSTRTEETRVPETGLPANPERTQNSSTCTEEVLTPKTEGPPTSPARTQEIFTRTGPETEGLPGNVIAGGTTKKGILRLRRYQLELTRAPLQGTNSIICAPRGCGKTVMAGHVIHQLSLQKKIPDRPFKALFIGSIRKLVEQKSTILSEFLNGQGFKVGVIGEGRNINNILESSTVVVVTAMIVKNAIMNGTVKLTDVDLLVFDECHHAYGSHPYNELMCTYLEDKLHNHTRGLPQILGLTAATQTAKFKTARDHFVTLCGNLDCHQISQVRDNLEELQIFHPKPSEIEIIAVPRRAESDPFRVQLLDFMKEIQKNIKEKCEVSPGTHAYETWAFSRRKTAEKKRQLDKMMTYNALLTLNSALVVHEELRGIDSLKMLQDFFSDPKNTNFGGFWYYSLGKINLEIFINYIKMKFSYFENEKKWYTSFTKLEPELKLLIDGTDENVLLISLRTLLQTQHHSKDAQGLLLTRTRFLTEKLVQYIKGRPELTETVRPARLTGQEGDQYSMTEEEQKEVLQQFKNDTVNLLVATDVAEGVDLPQCDYMIRYNVTTNQIDALQLRGKARHCYLIVQEGSDAEEKENKNRKKMRQMEETLEHFRNEDPTKLADLIEKKQREDWELYKSKKKHQGTSAKSTKSADPSRVLIICIQCNSHLTFGEHIIKKGTFYICVDEELPDRVIENRWDDSDSRWKVLSTAYHVGEIICRNDTCSRKLGQIVQFRKGTRKEGFLLCPKNIMFDRGGRQVKECRAWSKVAFPVKEEAIDE